MKKGKSTIILLTGALAGVAAAFYCVVTPKGRKFINNALGQSRELKKSVQSHTQALTQNARDTTKEVLDVASEKFDSAKDSINSTAQNIAETAEDKLGGFEQGVAKAKEILNKH